MAPAVSRLLAFAGVEEFARRHRGGTEAEFLGNQKLVEETNKRNLQFQSWFVSTTRKTSKRVEYLVVVRPGQGGEGSIPQLGEPAKLRVALGDDNFTRFWDARRLETPATALRAAANPSEKLTYFKVTSPIADAHQGVRTLLDFPAAEADDNTDDTADTTSCDREVALTNENSVLVNFLLVASEATKNSELGALDHLWGRFANASEQQTLAFKYFVTLRDPEFFVDLHQQIPHLKGAMDDPTWPGSPLEKKFARLNPQQKAAYLEGFRRLECGICILPGGPGAGKTHFNIFTIAMAQSQPLPRPVMIKGKPTRRYAKVLFIVDMNAPVDDVANRMVATYKELGMNKVCIRMKGWGSEISSSDRLNSVEDAGSGDVVPVDFSKGFLETAKLMGTDDPRRTCQALTLDEAAWEHYDKFKSTQYEGLTEYLNTDLWEEAEIVPFRFRCLLYHLYRDTLENADFIATTPVAASNHFKGMFKPDLVYFDEAPHARELTNLIAIANFEPIAYIFCGDHRQTIPFVGSAGDDDENPFKQQMQTSMMERAAAAGVIHYELLMNHRAFGGLEQLASVMWYDGKMISGNESTPASVTHMLSYLGQFKDGKPCTTPRLLVHLKNCGPESRDGTSAWNPSHMTWVMERINELLLDHEFKHAERDQPGTILVISPYKKAFHEYKKEIKKLPAWAQKRVETRTVDVVQGHEADFVFLDLVKDRSTKFLDNPNRLCVALTRARIGEIVMMHPNMVHSATFKRNSENLRPIHELCSKAGQVVHVDPATSSRVALPLVTP
ncbi:P-loop containing nucleoside triphosphate hydrolase protein, partial [Dichotomopilus funicola]